PGLSTDTFEALGVPVPENYSAPSTTGLEDTVGVHMQAFRLGDILFTVCSCEQWVDQAYNIKTRTDTKPGNEYLGYDVTSPNAGDYYATRLSQMGHALKGDSAAAKTVDGQTDPQRADADWAPMVGKEVVDQNHEEAKVRAVGEASSAGVQAYAHTLPNDGGSD